MKDDNKAFTISYSGASKEELESYKEKYTPKAYTEKMRKLRAYDRSVDTIATMISILLGMAGAALLILGSIYIIKEELPTLSGVLMTFFGVAVDSSVPFVHTKIYNALKKHYAPKILALIKEIEENKF